MGRPPRLSGDLVAISVHGKSAAWCNGRFAGDPDIVNDARLAVRLELPVQIGHNSYQAGDDEALGALAALLSHSAQARVIQLPDHIAELLATDAENLTEMWGEPDVPRNQ